MWTRKSALLFGGAVLALLFGLFFANPRLIGVSLVLLVFMTVVALTTRYPEIVPHDRPMRPEAAPPPGNLRVIREVHAGRVFENQRVPVTLRVEKIGRPRGQVEVFDHLPETLDIVAGSNHRLIDLASDDLALEYTLDCPIMGPFVLGPVRFRWGDLSNMFYREYQIEEVSDLTVLPLLQDLNLAPVHARRPRLFSGSTTVRQPGPGSEFFTLREFIAGDDSRLINWKATSRRQRLMVNVHEREAVTTSLIVVDATAASAYGRVDQTSLLLSCRAAATLARAWIRRKENVGLVIFGEGIRILNAASGDGQLEKILVNLALARPGGTTSFAAVAEVLTPYIPHKSSVVLISSAEEDPTLVAGMQHLLEQDLDPVLLCPLLYPREWAAGHRDDVSAAIRALEKDVELDRVRFIGAKAVPWDPNQPLETALQEVTL